MTAQGRIIAAWPQLMKRKTAADYLDMSEAAFVREVLAGRLPMSVTVGGREHWRKDAIDKALDRMTGDSDVPDYLREFNEKYGEAT